MAKIVGIDKLFLRRFFGSELNSHNIGNNSQSNSNNKQRIANLSAVKYLVKLLSIHDDNQSNIIAVTMLTILKIIAFVTMFTLAEMGIRYNRPAQVVVGRKSEDNPEERNSDEGSSRKEF